MDCLLGHLTETRLDTSGKVSGMIKKEQVRSRLCKKKKDQERLSCNRVHVRKVGSEKINAEHLRSMGSCMKKRDQVRSMWKI